MVSPRFAPPPPPSFPAPSCFPSLSASLSSSLCFFGVPARAVDHATFVRCGFSAALRLTNGQDLADRLAQGFTDLIQSHIAPPHFASPPSAPKNPFDLDLHHAAADHKELFPSAATIFDLGGRIGQAGVELGTCINAVVHQFFRRLPAPFRPEEGSAAATAERRSWDEAAERRGGGEAKVIGLAAERLGDRGFVAAAPTAAGSSLDEEEDEFGFDLGALGRFKRPRDRKGRQDRLFTAAGESPPLG